jgi:hypothetical protein
MLIAIPLGALDEETTDIANTVMQHYKAQRNATHGMQLVKTQQRYRYCTFASQLLGRFKSTASAQHSRLFKCSSAAACYYSRTYRVWESAHDGRTRWAQIGSKRVN